MNLMRHFHIFKLYNKVRHVFFHLLVGHLTFDRFERSHNGLNTNLKLVSVKYIYSAEVGPYIQPVS